MDRVSDERLALYEAAFKPGAAPSRPLSHAETDELLADLRDCRAERDALREQLTVSHKNRTAESVHYASLCAEIIEACGADGGTAVAACASVTAERDRLRALLVRARDAVSGLLKDEVVAMHPSSDPSYRAAHDVAHSERRKSSSILLADIDAALKTEAGEAGGETGSGVFTHGQDVSPHRDGAVAPERNASPAQPPAPDLQRVTITPEGIRNVSAESIIYSPEAQQHFADLQRDAAVGRAATGANPLHPVEHAALKTEAGAGVQTPAGSRASGGVAVRLGDSSGSAAPAPDLQREEVSQMQEPTSGDRTTASGRRLGKSALRMVSDADLYRLAEIAVRETRDVYDRNAEDMVHLIAARAVERWRKER